MRTYSVLATAAIVASLMLQENRAVHAPGMVALEQLRFSAEQPIPRPVSLPLDVVATLRRDDDVRAALESQNLKPGQMPLSWFAASEVNVSRPVWAGLVAKGEGPLLGANVTAYWIFHTFKGRHELVLQTHGHDLVVEKKFWHGYPELTTMSATAEEVTTIRYRFEGRKYVEFARATEAIK